MDHGGFLPPEIITGIMTRLCVKPLLRFRCVSKQWCALIDSPYFTKKHLIHSTQTNKNVRLIVSHFANPRIYSVCEPLEKKNNELVIVELFPPVIKTPNSPFLVVGSCNGLLCLSFSRERVLVYWNPTTKKQWFSPPRPRKTVSVVFVERCAYGFGYVSQANDYKTVMIRQCYGRDCVYLFTEVDVYSLRSNSWTRVQGFPNDMSIWLQPVVLVNECLHWLAGMKMYQQKFIFDQIVAFEIGSESFRMLSLPDAEITGVDVSIQALGGCLCAFYNFNNLSFEVWVMKEYGVKDSWTKLFAIDHSKNGDLSGYFDLWPITYSRDGDKILFECKQRSLLKNEMIFSYDFVRKIFEEVEIHGMPNRFVAMAYSESLVNPNGGDLHDWEK